MLAYRTWGRGIHAHARICAVRGWSRLGSVATARGARGWCVNGYHVCPMWAHGAAGALAGWRGRANSVNSVCSVCVVSRRVCVPSGHMNEEV